MLKDPLCDWLKYNYSSLISKKPTYTREVFRALGSSKSSRFSFPEYLMNQGTIFEDKIIGLLIERFGVDMVARIGGDLSPRSAKKVQETVDAMNKGIPIIHSGLLHNPENKTYGIPDLLIRSDWINNLVSVNPIPRSKKRISAPRLRDPLYPDKSPSYHYIIVDIKFSTLLLRADGINLLNAGSFPAYKSQLLIYNQALALLQGYDPQKAYILGRRWKFTCLGRPYKGESCFDRLGTIDYTDVDLKYVGRTEQALRWLREVRSEDAEKWDITKSPFSRKELYPNMSNYHDYPWRPIKAKIAREIFELTSLWMVGVKHREFAHNRKIYGWNDENCISKNLNITGEFTSRLLTEILKVNQPHMLEQYPNSVYPEQIRNNYLRWQEPDTVEFYVDFETVSNVMTDFSCLPQVKDTTIIFMIGVGHINPCTQEWVHRSFITNRLTLKEEERVCHEFAEYIRTESALYNIERPLCVHWAPAEDKMWERAKQRHPNTFEGWQSERWQWFDLLKVFKEEPIVVRGALNFSLKSITKALNKNKCINIDWNTNSSCLDGQGAMIGAYRASQRARELDISMKDTPEIKEIDEYNKIDVKALQQIISYLRENHTLPILKKGTKRSPGADSVEGLPPLRRSKRIRRATLASIAGKVI